MTRGFVGAVLIATACCGGKGGTSTNPHPELTVDQVLAQLAQKRNALTAFTGEATMDYWLSGQRAKGDVLVMGTVGKKVRFAALSPAGGSTLAEMACDGANFVYVDYQNNCALTGPCDAQSVGVFFGIALEPDDFVHLALGTPPALGGNPTGKLSWDSSKGAEHLELTSSEGTQRMSIDTKQDHWDVLDSEIVGTDGKTRWSVANTDFRTVEGSGQQRVPGKTRFKSPAQNQDLLVEWSELKVNVTPPANAFVLQAPQGLPQCGAKAPAAQPKAPAGAAPAKPKS